MVPRPLVKWNRLSRTTHAGGEQKTTPSTFQYHWTDLCWGTRGSTLLLCWQHKTNPGKKVNITFVFLAKQFRPKHRKVCEPHLPNPQFSIFTVLGSHQYFLIHKVWCCVFFFFPFKLFIALARDRFLKAHGWCLESCLDVCLGSNHVWSICICKLCDSLFRPGRILGKEHSKWEILARYRHLPISEQS